MFQVDAALNLVSSLVCDQDDQPSEPVSNLHMHTVQQTVNIGGGVEGGGCKW